MPARLRRPLSPEAYRRVTIGALVLLVLIVVTGAGVRLTGSGLGCSDWPGCHDDQLVAEMELHPMIEFVNRLITGAVSVAVALAVLGSLRRVPRRKDLLWLSLGLVGGVIGQILIGRIVVVTHLNPWWVQMHMVMSLVLIWNAVLLTHRAGIPDGAVSRPTVTPALGIWGRAVVAMSILVLATGTLVTGSGPHSGHNEDDPYEVRRLPIAVHDAARIHGVTVMLFLAVVVWVLVQVRRHHPAGELRRGADLLLALVVLQGAVGYTQYFTGVPPLLVALHIFGACLVFVGSLRLLLRMSSPVERPDAEGPSWNGDLGRPRTPGDLVS